MSTSRPTDRKVYTVPTGGDIRRELLAMREWSLVLERDTRRPLLKSLNGEQAWLGPVLEWPWSPDEPAGPSTGVHGMTRWARRRMWDMGWFYGPDTWAWGWVALSGLVEENAAGFRAQRAVIRHLRLGARALALCTTREEAGGLVFFLEERYQCPVKFGYPEWRVSRAMLG